MLAYLITIEIALSIYSIYESYRYFIYKYRSSLVIATIKDIQHYEIYQRPSTKVIEGQKRAMKVLLEYEINEIKYTKTEKIKENILTAKIGETINLKIVTHSPEQCSLKPDYVRFRRMILAIIGLLVWSVLIYFII